MEAVPAAASPLTVPAARIDFDTEDRHWISSKLRARHVCLPVFASMTGNQAHRVLEALAQEIESGGCR